MEGTNLFLGGFMASGKTAVGKEISRLSGRPFLDVDGLIEQRKGMSVAEIFESKGELCFRRLEAETVREACGLENTVIALGGGSLLNGDLKDLILQRGKLVILDVLPETVLERTRCERDKRPLLEPHVLKDLMARRREAYACGDYRVPTDGRNVGALAGEILRRFGIRARCSVPGRDRLPGDERVVTGHIYVGRGILAKKTRELVEGSSGSFFTVADKITGPLYGEGLGKSRGAFLLPRGEAAKQLSMVEKLWQAFSNSGVDRGDMVVALGGGTVGDAAGFAASTWLRGIPVIQCPTTLLAQVDSAVGGKTGVNLPEGKNLVGSFHQPRAVVSDVECLLSLSWKDYRQGLAEAVKYGLGEDSALLGWIGEHARGLRGRDPGLLVELVARCAAIKADVVREDEKEQKGVRERLNLGHTVAHSLEAASRYEDWSHGDAVSVGMVVAAHLSFRLGQCERETPTQLMELLSELGLPVAPDIPWEEIQPRLLRDKKFRGGGPRLVLPRTKDRAVVRDDVPLKMLQECYEEVLAWNGGSPLPC
ncbi:MAG: 3-dehydroquinate synthase [Thermovirgaceae bacterium]